MNRARIRTAILTPTPYERVVNGLAPLAHWPLTELTGTIADNARYTDAPGPLALLNGGFENWSSATDADNWSENIAGGSTINQETSDVHGGANAARADIDASNNNATLAQTLSATGLNIGDTVQITGWNKVNSIAGDPSFRVDFSSVSGPTTPLTIDWSQFDYSRISTVNLALALARGSAASKSIFWDNVTAFKTGELDALYVGPTQNDDTIMGLPAPTFTVNDKLTLEHNRLETVFNPDLGSMSCIIKMPESALNSVNVHGFIQIGVDVNNRLSLIHTDVADRLSLRVGVGGITQLVNIDTVDAYDKRMHIVGTWSRADNRVRVYVGDTMVETTYPTAGTWTASPLTAQWSTIGAIDTGSYMEGTIGQVHPYDYELTPGQVSSLYLAAKAQGQAAGEAWA